MSGPAISAMAPAGVTVRAWRKPFAEGVPQRLDVPAGLTLAEIVTRLGWPAWCHGYTVIEVGDAAWRHRPQRVPPDWYGRVRPNPGTEVRVWLVPLGGGGGGGGKNPLRTVLMLGLVVATLAFAGPVGTALVGAGGITVFGSVLTATQVGAALVGVVGSLLINALVPPPRPRLSQLSGGLRDSATLSVSGTRNRLDPFGQVPRLFGRHKVVPPKAHPPVTESQGRDQYVRELFVVEGPLLVEDIRLGATPIEQFEDVTLHVHQDWQGEPLEFWSNRIIQDNFNLELLPNVPKVVSTRAETIEITYEFTYPGLARVVGSGLESRTVEIQVDYRPEGAADWIPITVHEVNARTTQIYRSGHRQFGLVQRPNRYEIRFTRLTPATDDPDTSDRSFLTALRSVRPGVPVVRRGVTLIELRIRANEQLNGPVDELSFVGTAILPAWNGQAWVAAPTRHPAAAYLAVLRGPGNRRPIPDDRIDWPRFQQWMASDPGRTFDAVIDFSVTVHELLRDIAGAARAAPDIVDGRHTVVRDVPQSVPVQFFGPRTVRRFSGRKNFHKRSDGLRVRFLAPERDWQQDELIVLRPGVAAAEARDLEPLELFGITDPTLARRDGLYRLAEAEHRSGEMWEIEADIDHLRATRGDRVRFAHDVPQIGIQTARVQARTEAAGLVVAVTLDELVPMEAGKSYAIEVRRPGGRQVVLAVVTDPGEQQTLQLVEPQQVGTNTAPGAGDFVAFGQAGQTMLDCLVREIRPGRDETATLVLVPYAEPVFTADQGTFPPYVPLISTDPRLIAPGQVQALTVSEVVRFPAGRAVSDLVATWQPPATGIAARYRVFGQPLGDGRWVQIGESGELSLQVATDRVRGEVVPLAVAGVSLAGRILPQSAWGSVSYTVQGDLVPPPPVQGLIAEQDTATGIRRIRWSYPTRPPDLAGFAIRQRSGTATNWAQGAVLASVHPASPFETTRIPAGQQTLMVRAVDHAGNLSEIRSVTVFLSDRIASNLVITSDYRALGWPGTIEGGTVDGDGSLLGGDNIAMPWPYQAADPFGAATDPPFGPLTGPAWSGQDEPPFGAATDPPFPTVYPALVYSDSFAAGTGGPLWIDAAGTGDITLAYRPQGAADWGAYTGRVTVPAGTYELQVTVLSGAARARLTTLRAHVDVPDVIERLSGVAIAAVGTRLPLAQTFAAIANVSLTVVAAGGSPAISARVVDKDVSGPLVQAFDAAGVAVDGTVDATVQGY